VGVGEGEEGGEIKKMLFLGGGGGGGGGLDWIDLAQDRDRWWW